MKSADVYRAVLFALVCAGTAAFAGDAGDLCDLTFECVASRRFQLDGTRPLPEPAFWPGAQYTVTVTSLPASVAFVTDAGAELFRYEVASTNHPPLPFELSLLVSGRSRIGVYAGRGETARLLDLVPPGKRFNPCSSALTHSLRFRAGGGAANPRTFLSAGIGQADVRFVTEGRENRPYVENGRLYFTFSARSYGSWLGVMSVDPSCPSDVRLEGTIFFDYGDGLVRNDLAADLFHDTVDGNWKAYVCNFSTGGDGLGGRATGGVNVAWCQTNPLHGVTVMKARNLGLAGMNEDPDGLWDPEAGKWRLFLSEFTPKGIRASLWESPDWDGPFVRLTDPVQPDSTGTTVFSYGDRRYCLFGSADRACYVYSYPSLRPVGKLKIDNPPWPEKGGWPHGRVWPALAEYEKGGRKECLMVTMDRENFPNMPKPNWTYGRLHFYKVRPCLR